MIYSLCIYLGVGCVGLRNLFGALEYSSLFLKQEFNVMYRRLVLWERLHESVDCDSFDCDSCDSATVSIVTTTRHFFLLTI